MIALRGEVAIFSCALFCAGRRAHMYIGTTLQSQIKRPEHVLKNSTTTHFSGNVYHPSPRDRAPPSPIVCCIVPEVFAVIA